MSVCFFFAKVGVEVGRPKRNDDVEEEDEVNHGVDEGDEVARDETWAVLAVENGDRDSYRIIHGEADDHHLPVLDKLAAVAEYNLAIRGFNWSLLLLNLEEWLQVRPAQLRVFLDTRLA